MHLDEFGKLSLPLNSIARNKNQQGCIKIKQTFVMYAFVVVFKIENIFSENYTIYIVNSFLEFDSRVTGLLLESCATG